MAYLPGALQLSKGGKAHESAAGEAPAGKSMEPSQRAWGSKEGSNQGDSAAAPKSSKAVPATGDYLFRLPGSARIRSHHSIQKHTG